MFYGFNMGPRGRMNGHRVFRPGIFLGIIGLLYFGWIILAVFGALLGAGAMILSSVFAGLVRYAPALLSRVFSSGGFAVGIVIGLLLYFRNHRKNTAKEAEAAPEREAARESADAANAAEEIIEAPRYRTF